MTKVAKQASGVAISYPQAVQQVIAQDGVKGLFFRGLGTRIMTNAIQGMLFTVIWRALEDRVLAGKALATAK